MKPQKQIDLETFAEFMGPVIKNVLNPKISGAGIFEDPIGDYDYNYDNDYERPSFPMDLIYQEEESDRKTPKEIVQEWRKVLNGNNRSSS